jgi:ParB family chromosome partitioning protein
LAKGREKQAHGLTAPGKTLLSNFDKSVDDPHNTQPGKTLLFQNNKSVDDTHNTRKTIADDTKISTGQLAKVEQIIKRAPEEVKDKLRKGEVSIGKAYREIKGDTIATKWTGDQESYTPEIYVEAARSVMGSIDVDPASNDIAQKTIKAKIYYTKENNGLNKPWDGNIFLNPPYGHPEIKQFIDKLLGELEEGQQAILLTNNNTDTTWFHDAAKKARLVCFTKGRINFYKSDGRTTNPTNGQVFFYFGKNHKRFSEVFGEFGLIMGREDDSIS